MKSTLLPLSPTTQSIPRSEKGSALLISLTLILLVSIILGSTLPMVLTNQRMALRQTMGLAAFNFAEMGIEQAFYDVNAASSLTELTSSGWTAHGTGFLSRQISDSEMPENIGSGLSGTLRIVIENPFGRSSFRVWAEASIIDSRPGSAPVRRIIETELGAAATSPHVGFVSLNGMNFNGRPTFDSFDSDVWPHTYTYGAPNWGQNITVASPNTNNGSINLGGSKIYGNVATGAQNPAQAINGNNYTVTGQIIGDWSMDVTPVVRPDTTGYQTSF